MPKAVQTKQEPTFPYTPKPLVTFMVTLIRDLGGFIGPKLALGNLRVPHYVGDLERDLNLENPKP